MAALRKRIDLYVGPGVSVSRDDLPLLDKSGDYVAELKHDGFWCLAGIEDGNVYSLLSRKGLPLSAPGLLGERVASAGAGLLVGELVSDIVDGEDGEARTGTKRLHLFDAISFNGHDLRALPLEDRRDALQMIAGTFARPTADEHLFLVERRESGFLAWYDAEVSRDGKSRLIGKRAEGLVLKRRGTAYRAGKADGKVDFWLRCKPLATVDYVVM